MEGESEFDQKKELPFVHNHYSVEYIHCQPNTRTIIVEELNQTLCVRNYVVFSSFSLPYLSSFLSFLPFSSLSLSLLCGKAQRMSRYCWKREEKAVSLPDFFLPGW